MSAHPKPASDAVDLSKLPKKRCANCPKMFPATKKTRRFCSDACRLEFHTYGSSYGKLKEKLTELIHKESRGIVGEEFGRYVAGKDFKRAMAAAGFIHRSQMRKPAPDRRPGALLAEIQRIHKIVIDVTLAQSKRIEDLSRRISELTQPGAPPVEAPPQSTRTRRAKSDTAPGVTTEPRAAGLQFGTNS